MANNESDYTQEELLNGILNEVTRVTKSIKAELNYSDEAIIDAESKSIIDNITSSLEELDFNIGTNVIHLKDSLGLDRNTNVDKEREY